MQATQPPGAGPVPFGIAGLQLAHAPGDNLERIAAEIASVARRFPWVRMVLLGELGCTSAQGYLHGRAMPLAEFIAWWREREGRAG